MAVYVGSMKLALTTPTKVTLVGSSGIPACQKTCGRIAKQRNPLAGFSYKLSTRLANSQISNTRLKNTKIQNYNLFHKVIYVVIRKDLGETSICHNV